MSHRCRRHRHIELGRLQAVCVRGSGSWDPNTGLWEMNFLVLWNAVAVAHETYEGGRELKSGTHVKPFLSLTTSQRPQ